MEPRQREQKQAELAELRARVERLQAELSAEPIAPGAWRGEEFYAAYYATTGFLLGSLGAVTSLLLNVIGSALYDKPSPLWLVQVYLTFPLGARALEPGFDSGLALAIGCCLYIGTGMLLGIPFQLLLGRYAVEGTVVTRLLLATGLALVVWLVNFYGILSWLQPLLFGGRWIVDEIPWYVGALTHLVYGWTMALVFPLGAYEPYRLQTEPRG